MLSRRFFFRFVLFGLVSVFGSSLFAQNADGTLTADVLIKTLYARTAAEKQYCEDVIAARDAKILPNRILYAAYRYAVQKDKDRRFTYFQTVLTKFCKEAGVDINTDSSSSSSGKSFNLFRFFVSPFK